MTATPRVSPDWSRFAACHICDVAATEPCRNRVRQHPERVLLVDRDPAGVMLLGRGEDVAWSREGVTRGAHHAAVAGVAVCNAAAIAAGTSVPLPELALLERCQRGACKRLWSYEEVMA